MKANITSKALGFSSRAYLPILPCSVGLPAAALLIFSWPSSRS